MNTKVNPRLLRAIHASDEDDRLDLLSALVIEGRKGIFQPTIEDAELLVSSLSKETDLLLESALWGVLKFAPSLDRLREYAEAVVFDANATSRGAALSYLLRAYPANSAAIVSRLKDDPDPYVKHQVAKSLSNTAPRQAFKIWFELLQKSDLPLDLFEIVPLWLAKVCTRDELALLKAEDLNCGGNSFWGNVSIVASNQLKKKRV